MYRYLWLLLVPKAACAQGGFAPGVVDHHPTNDERTEGNSIKDQSQCKKQRGEWFQGTGYPSYCVLPYPDAGKPCKNSNDCVGYCIAPITDKPVEVGACQVDDSTDDCGRPHLENGKVTYFDCD